MVKRGYKKDSLGLVVYCNKPQADLEGIGGFNGVLWYFRGGPMCV